MESTVNPNVPEITFRTTITAAEARESLWGAYYRKRFLGLLLILAVVSLVIVVNTLRTEADSYSLLFGLSLGLGGFLVVAVIYITAIFGYGSTVASCNRSHEGTAWRITDEGAQVEEVNAKTLLKWTAFQGFTETNTLVLIRLARKKTYLIIPKRCLTPTQANGLIAVLLAKLPRITL